MPPTFETAHSAENFAFHTESKPEYNISDAGERVRSTGVQSSQGSGLKTKFDEKNVTFNFLTVLRKFTARVISRTFADEKVREFVV